MVPDYILNEQKLRPDGPMPPQYTVMFWRYLAIYTWYFGFELLGSPMLDLTHAGNTTLHGHLDGIQSLKEYSMLSAMVILDGRGEGETNISIMWCCG